MTSLDSAKTPESTIEENQQKIIRLLEEQNALLHSLGSNITSAMEQDEKSYYHFSKILDLDIPLSNMVKLSFKWLVASIPVGIVIGIVYTLIIAIVG